MKKDVYIILRPGERPSDEPGKFPSVYDIVVSPENLSKAEKISKEKFKHAFIRLYSTHIEIYNTFKDYNVVFSQYAETAQIDINSRTIYINPFYFSVLTYKECISLILHEIFHAYFGYDAIQKGLKIELGSVKTNLLNVAHDFIINDIIVRQYKLPLASVCISTQKSGIKILNKYCQGDFAPALYFPAEEWKKYGIDFNPIDIYKYIVNNCNMWMEVIVFEYGVRHGKTVIRGVVYHDKIPLSINDSINKVINDIKKRIGYDPRKHMLLYMVFIQIKLPNGEVITTTKDGGFGRGGVKEREDERKRKPGRVRIPPVPGDHVAEKLWKVMYQGLIDWKQLLYKYLTYSLMQSTRGFEDYSYYPPSRRTESLKPYIKDTVLPSLVSSIEKIKMALAVDISPSISHVLLSVFVNEVIRILNQFEDYEILLIQCDDHVCVTDDRLVDDKRGVFKCNYNDYILLRRGQRPPENFWRKPTGYTWFVPPFALVENMKFKPDVFVYLTDLEPIIEPHYPPKPIYPVVWVWATRGLEYPLSIPPFGELVRLDYLDVVKIEL